MRCCSLVRLSYQTFAASSPHSLMRLASGTALNQRTIFSCMSHLGLLAISEIFLGYFTHFLFGECASLDHVAAVAGKAEISELVRQGIIEPVEGEAGIAVVRLRYGFFFCDVA